MYYVYVVQCADGSLYTGITTDVARRVQEHNDSPKGAKYTKTRRPVVLKHVEELEDKSAAQRREYEVKHLPRAEKLKLQNA